MIIEHITVLARFDLNSITIGRGRSCFPYALQSAPAMHSALALAAAFWTAKLPSLDSSIQMEGFRQKGKAMGMVRHWLARKQGQKNAADDTVFVAAMSILATVEVS